MRVMNKTKIDWCDYTWNPATGCLHGCHYCYARRIAERFKGKAFPNGFKPTFYPERLQEPMKVKKPSKIFVCSMADLFGKWTWDINNVKGFATTNYIVECILNTVKQCPQHTFIFLTKNPYFMLNYEFPQNSWVGMTVDGLTDCLDKVAMIKNVPASIKFISFEPLLNWPAGINLRAIDWVIIGAQTGPGARPPKPKWIQKILDTCRNLNIPCFIKDNVKWHEKIQEFPEVD